MSNKSGESELHTKIDSDRRRLVTTLLAGSGAALTTAVVAKAEDVDDLRFPGDEPTHKIVYQLNKADIATQEHILFSIGAVLRKYGDDVKIVVACFGEGLQVLAKKPIRSIAKSAKTRISSMAQYGIEFHACGNTLESLSWTMDELIEEASYVESGVADIMEMQEQGYAYFSW